MTLRLLLVRHGLSSFNLERRIQGRDDLSNLTESGHEQARRLGASLADVPLDAVYSSRLQRAAATTASCSKPAAVMPLPPCLMTACSKWISSPGQD